MSKKESFVSERKCFYFIFQQKGLIHRSELNFYTDNLHKTVATHFQNNEKNCLLNPSERCLNDYEASFNFGPDFDFDFNFFKNPILTSQRLKIGSQIFHSQDYARVGPRKSNFIISYKNQNATQYGLIKYFLQIKEELFVAINELKVCGNIYEKTGARTSVDLRNMRDRGAFDKYFCECREIEKLLFILVKSFPF